MSRNQNQFDPLEGTAEDSEIWAIRATLAALAAPQNAHQEALQKDQEDQEDPKTTATATAAALGPDAEAGNADVENADAENADAENADAKNSDIDAAAALSPPFPVHLEGDLASTKIKHETHDDLDALVDVRIVRRIQQMAATARRLFLAKRDTCKPKRREHVEAMRAAFDAVVRAASDDTDPETLYAQLGRICEASLDAAL
jgi:hypothetical protein